MRTARGGGRLPGALAPALAGMVVRTLFFAAYRDALGCSALQVELPEGASVRHLLAELQARGGPFAALPKEPAIAVNRTLAHRDTPLTGGDEIAFLPPVAGG